MRPHLRTSRATSRPQLVNNKAAKLTLREFLKILLAMLPVQSNEPPAQPQITTPAPLEELPREPEKRITAPHHTSWGAFIGIIIIVVVLIAGALYFWGAKLAERDAAFQSPNAETSTAR